MALSGLWTTLFILHQLHHLNSIWKISSECKSCVPDRSQISISVGAVCDGRCVFGFTGNKNTQTSFFCLSNNRAESRVSTGHTNLHITFKQPPEKQSQRAESARVTRRLHVTFKQPPQNLWLCTGLWECVKLSRVTHSPDSNHWTEVIIQILFIINNNYWLLLPN